MKLLVNVNGALHPADAPVLPVDNRAYHFGDGLFETMRVVNGRPCFIDAHWARLTTGAELLKIQYLLPWTGKASRTAFCSWCTKRVS